MRVHQKVVLFSLFLGLVFWFFNAFIDYLAFGGRSFLGALIFNISPNEWYIRLFIFVSFLVFGIVVSLILKRNYQYQKKLVKRENELLITLNSIADAVITTDVKGRIDFMNPVAVSLTGWEEKEAIGKKLEEVLRVVDEDTGEKCEGLAFKVIDSDQAAKIKENCILTDRRGRCIPVGGSIAPIKHDDNTYLGVILAFRDISMRKQAEEQNRYYASIMEGVSEAIFSWSPDLKIISWNKAAEEIYGWKAKDVIGKNVNEIVVSQFNIPEEDMRKILHKTGAWKGEVVQTRKDGQKLNILLSITLIKDEKDQLIGMVAVNRDISKRVAAESALRMSEEKFRTLSELSIMAVFIYRGRDVLYHNKAMMNLMDIPEEEMEDFHLENFVSRVYEDDKDLITEQAQRKYAGDSGIIPRYTFRIFDSQKKMKWIDLYSRRINYIDGPAVLVTMVDITDRMLAERALTEQKERLDVTLRSIGDGVIATDEQGRVLVINKVAEELTGWQEAEAFGKPLSEVFNIINENTRARLENPVDKVLKTGGIVSLDNHTILISRDGRERIIADSGAPIRDKSGSVIGVVLVFRDYTETRRLHDFASRAQRLETAGRIAAQVAHDFNNLLGPLTAYPALIRDELPAEHPAVELVDQIEKSAHQIAEINQQLLTLGRRGHYALKPLNLNKIVMQVVRQFYPLSEAMQVETDLCNGLLNIKGGSSQVYRVISNLVANSFDAMSGVGKLTIKTENFYADEISGKSSRIPKGEFVKLTVSDTGVGIPADVLPKIFDPFFTTKSTEKARGSGLGLSVVHSVVEDHGGYIDFISKPGFGTSFYLYFPITREAIDIQASGQSLGGKERILIVDDDPTQREVTRVLLEKLGYKTESAESGEEAISRLGKKSYDLLVLDMIMPGGMDGTDTYRKALEINPEQKAILVSGYAESHRVDEAIKLGAGLFIRKPVTIKSLGNAARRVLDEPVKSGSQG